MGIKPSYIKNLGEELMEKHGEKFSNNFDENKHAVLEAAVIDSKRVRNRVAGYISRKINRRRR
ncbi:30S ribosomal protein S17e [Methanoculleus taiwanensis]|uniref:Small ribosomal subunit protein eS17 n=1 Tax=Methanoculleus taiwanensis TaxID=1550565 RepID=A0A498GY69_9EURY|nr:30S ribosomal protein S17e [Methanoculleus taiwanensis]RXE55423.1 30S ribosomal protein S17e [Methanoculleus taiwanensis]